MNEGSGCVCVLQCGQCFNDSSILRRHRLAKHPGSDPNYHSLRKRAGSGKHGAFRSKTGVPPHGTPSYFLHQKKTRLSVVVGAINTLSIKRNSCNVTWPRSPANMASFALADFTSKWKFGKPCTRGLLFQPNSRKYNRHAGKHAVKTDAPHQKSLSRHISGRIAIRSLVPELPIPLLYHCTYCTFLAPCQPQL